MVLQYVFEEREMLAKFGLVIFHTSCVGASFGCVSFIKYYTPTKYYYKFEE